MVCSRLIDNCKVYETSFECYKCNDGYVEKIELDKSHYQVNCMEKNDISNCKEYGALTYLNLNYHTMIVNGCTKCKNRYTTGSDCEEYNFTGDD